MNNLYFPASANDAKQLSKRVSSGELKRIRQGIYTDAPWEQVPALVQSRWYDIVDYLFENGIASHVTAAELRPVDGRVFISADIKHRKKITIANTLTIDAYPGDTQLLTESFVPNLRRSAPARYLLENLQATRKRAGDTQSKAQGKAWVEGELCKILERRGEDELNRIRDLAREHASALSLEKEFEQLDKLIGAVLSTKPAEHLTTPQALAMARQQPFDANHVQAFEQLADYLSRCNLKPKDYQYSASTWRNLSFYESYFSNYIEGTEFLIDEAEDIIFSKNIIEQRQQDSHDVLSVFDVVQDYQEMTTTPSSAEELLSLLSERHKLIMHQRPEIHPGQFKSKANKAGDSLFVLPEQVEGTLAQTFGFYTALPAGLHRAIYMHYLIAEVHPFDDGNGRLARIMMNAELANAEQFKIIVPTVHRDSYLNGLIDATRRHKFRTMTKVFSDLQAYTASIEWGDYGEARSTLEAHYADKLPDQGVPIFNRQISTFKIELPVD
ncbi:MAG: Fic family protein [Oceanicoccus sp.]|uniref:Fic family protein n=1 Tax=Oceanicoccus sp. TaxID=2691044 RepID=UPI0026196878|nr:Fic family protein [Oceanicoccus sp.]MCP3907065.1 Fic family protein [Oceanicoccus sp.]